jgi:GNAT superfamily N-acetyltransferase
MFIDVRELTDADRAWARALLRERWGAEIVVTRGRPHRADLLPGLVAWLADGRVNADAAPGGARRGTGLGGGRERAGLLAFRIAGPECEIVSLDAVAQGAGIGTALLAAIRSVAAAAGCRRLWLITTNDNVPAQRFYERCGFHLAAVHGNALEESRRLKPSIPLAGFGGAPLRDELEYETALTPRTGAAA